MSISKRLAPYYAKDESSADAINILLNKFGLTSIAPRLGVYVHAHMMQCALYDTMYVRTVTELPHDALHALAQQIGAPHGTKVEVIIDPTILRGVEVMYGGKKFSSNAKAKLDRFVTSTSR